jgi:hypothetical protein
MLLYVSCALPFVGVFFGANFAFILSLVVCPHMTYNVVFVGKRFETYSADEVVFVF